MAVHHSTRHALPRAVPGLGARLRQRSVAIGSLALGLFLAGCTQIQSDRVSVDYYNISGDSTAALDEAIRKRGPRISGGRHAVAVARIRMVPNIVFTEPATGASNPRCSVVKADVTVDAKVTLPRWTGRNTASRKLGQAWDNIDRYTRQHEAYHVEIAFRYARKMEADLRALPQNLPCEELKLRTRLVIDQLLQEHDQAQKAFDANEQRRFRAIAQRKGKASGT